MELLGFCLRVCKVIALFGINSESEQGLGPRPSRRKKVPPSERSCAVEVIAFRGTFCLCLKVLLYLHLFCTRALDA
jgi:hypothetical protein